MPDEEVPGTPIALGGTDSGGAPNTGTPKDETFEAGDEQPDSFKSFLSKSPSEMSLDELYNELTTMQGQRMTKTKRKTVRKKKEREAKWMVDILNALPPPAREKITALPKEQRENVLRSLANSLNERIAKKAANKDEPPTTTIAKGQG